jgi:hypothetical protein
LVGLILIFCSATNPRKRLYLTAQTETVIIHFD